MATIDGINITIPTTGAIMPIRTITAGPPTSLLASVGGTIITSVLTITTVLATTITRIRATVTVLHEVIVA